MFIALLAVAAFGLADDTAFAASTPPEAWLNSNAPFGMDITLDGKVWINTNPVGGRDDYAVLAEDLYKAKMGNAQLPRLWVRGYHAKNGKVNYRESKFLVVINCQSQTLTVLTMARYNADGELVYSANGGTPEYIIPGSMGESWKTAACPSS